MSIKKDSALIVIDAPKEVLGTSYSTISALVCQFKKKNRTVIQVVTDGREYQSYGDVIVKKRKLSAFFGTDMDILLKDMGITTVYICGAYTDICVRSTAVDAHQNNYFFHVITDAVASTTEQAGKCALWNMKYLQRESNITFSEIMEE